MATHCRPWWRNCAMQTDPEILAIDALEDHVAPLDAGATGIRERISSLELCHHKADRWVDNIIEAIGKGETTKGLGTRSPGSRHPAETVWQQACAALAAWCAEGPARQTDLTVGATPASRLLAGLGERSPLKEWQVQRVIEKIRSVIRWQSEDDPTARYVWLLLGASEYECDYLDQCPEQYREHEDYWEATARTIIHDTERGDAAELSLALAIDMLWPCHWRFVENLRIVLDAIGGELEPEGPFAACGRNIILVPSRDRMKRISGTLKVFCGDQEPGREADGDILSLLGEPTETKRWLAASLGKTIRLQLDPLPDLRTASALAGPDWIRQPE